MSNKLASDEIILRVPACATHARIVRVGAAALALRQGMSFTEIDQLRAAIEPSADDTTAILCRFRTAPGSLELEASRTDGAAVAAPAAERFNEAVSSSNLTAAVDADRGLLRLSVKHADHDALSAS